MKKIFMYFSVCLIVLSMFSFSISEAKAAPYKISYYMYEGNKTVTPPSLTLPDNGEIMYINFNPSSDNNSWYYYDVYRNGVKIDSWGSEEVMYSERFYTPGTYSIKVTCLGSALKCKGEGYLLRQ